MITKEEAMKLAEWYSGSKYEQDKLVANWQSAGLVEPDKKSKLQEARAFAGSVIYGGKPTSFDCNQIKERYESVIKQHQEIVGKALDKMNNANRGLNLCA